MITTTCDMCGAKLHSLNNEVDLHLEYNGVHYLGANGFRSTNKQLCVTCATRLLNWIDSQLEKGDAE